MAGAQDWNRRTIDEFRANGGKVGGFWEGKPLLLLTTTGARSGRRHTNPMTYLLEGDRLFIFASKSGEPTHPAWYHNLLAHPEVIVEIGGQTYSAIARPVTGAERDRIYAGWEEVFPQATGYRQRTTRIIPVIELLRRSPETA
jgi:deazaflavin-dependent oxidoreductase (nitroreductase family)